MILALTRSLHHALYLSQLIQFCFYCFYTVPYLFCLFCLCDRVDDVPFEGEQEQIYEEEKQVSVISAEDWRTPIMEYLLGETLN